MSSGLQLLFFCLCLLKTLGLPTGSGDVRLVVEEGSDVILPCSLSTKENAEEKLFDWKKDGQKEIFFYDGGVHYNNGRPGQDQQFEGRVSHFQDELKYGNASIIIRKTKVTDSGNYTCVFPRVQSGPFRHIELLVELTFRDRSGETPGASAKPSIMTLNQTKDWALLQCDVRGASPKPTVEWQDSAGNKLPAEEPQVSERGGSFYISLQTTVKKTDRYRCVATQEEIKHQIEAETFVFISEKLVEDTCSRGEVTGWFVSGFSLGVITLAVVQALLRARKVITLRCNKGAAEKQKNSKKEKTVEESILRSPSDSPVQRNGYIRAPSEV